MKIAVVLSRIPYPLTKGDKLRAYFQIKELANKHEISLHCLTLKKPKEEYIYELQKICKEVHIYKLNKIAIPFYLLAGLFVQLPFQVLLFYQLKVHKKMIENIKRFDPNVIYSQLIRTSEYVKGLYDYPKIIDYMDALSKGIERRKHKVVFWKKWIFNLEYHKLKKYENRVFNYFDSKTIISEQDKLLIDHKEKQDIKVVPNGVDIKFFTPEVKQKKYDVVLVGNMSYSPNVQAAEFLATEILPLLVKHKKDVKICIAGIAPSKKVKALASENVIVTGWMKDIRNAYDESVVFVAPLDIGTGLQNKLLEAMSMEMPCITSQLVLNAFPKDKKPAIVTAGNAEEYVKQILHFIHNKEKAVLEGKNNRNFIINNFSWKSQTKILDELMMNGIYN